MSTVSAWFYRIIWHILVISYWIKFLIVHYLSLFSKHFFSNINPYNSPSTFMSQLKRIKKLPNHLALSFQYENSNNMIFSSDVINRDHDKYRNYVDKPVLNLQQIAKVTSWLAVGGIPIIGLYDYDGILKLNYASLINAVEESVRSISSEIFSKSRAKTPKIIWHKLQPHQRCISSNALESRKIQTGQLNPIVHIFIYSYEDGKPKLIEMVKEMNRDTLHNNKIDATVEFENTLVNVNSVNEYLKRKCCESLKTVDYKIEPDLLLNFGSTMSTLDFLPWHIRLTELHWLPQVNHIQLSDVLLSLFKFSKCEQRFGK